MPNLDPLYLAALVVVVTIHEFSHAAAADYLGDPTPRLQGRLTLNPLAHLDPIGSLMFLLVHFGWGKPVQFDPYNLHNPKRDAALISLAGPASNILTAIILSLLVHLLPFSQLPTDPNVFVSFAIRVIIVSVSLAVFNLIPIHPLDGGKILIGILPPDQARTVDLFLARYGTIILILLIISPLLGQIMSPIINLILSLLLPTSSAFI